LLAAAAAGLADGRALMWALNLAYGFVAVVCLVLLGPQRRQWLPSTALIAPALTLAVCALLPRLAAGTGMAAGLGAAALAALSVMLFGLLTSDDLRQALRR
jgi:hypothetical protein